MLIKHVSTEPCSNQSSMTDGIIVISASMVRLYYKNMHMYQCFTEADLEY